MGDPVEAGDLPGKDLTAPDRSVVAVSHAVDGDSDAFLPGRCGDVRPVVLDGEEFRPGLSGDLPRVASREELRVKVVDDPVVSGADEPPYPFDRLLQVGEGLRVPDVSDVRGRDAEPVLVDGDVCVQFRADTEDALIAEIDCRPLRGEAPRETDDAAVPNNGVVAPVDDPAVVREDVVHLFRKPFESGREIGDHRVARQVRTRHDEERVGEVCKEEVVQPGIGEHAPDGMEVGDPRVRRGVPLCEHHYRPLPGTENSPFFVRYNRDPLHLLRGRHHRKRLLRPAQTTFQGACRLLGAGDMKSAYPPDGDDRARIEEGCSFPDGVRRSKRRSVGPKKREVRPAGCTGDRLGVVAPARRVGVFTLTGGTHGKRLHGRTLPVVGEGVDDAVSGAAVDAGRGPVAFVSPAGCEDIGDAVVTGGDVGGDEAGEASRTALKDGKRFGRTAAHILDIYRIYLR